MIKFFLIGRIGQNLEVYNQKYSHGAFMFKKGAVWEVMHELNECSSDNSNVYNEGILNFFLDDLHKYESILVEFDYETNKKHINDFI